MEKYICTVPANEISKYISQIELFNLIRVSKSICNHFKYCLVPLKEWLDRKNKRIYVILFIFRGNCYILYKYNDRIALIMMEYSAELLKYFYHGSPSLSEKILDTIVKNENITINNGDYLGFYFLRGVKFIPTFDDIKMIRAKSAYWFYGKLYEKGPHISLHEYHLRQLDHGDYTFIVCANKWELVKENSKTYIDIHVPGHCKYRMRLFAHAIPYLIPPGYYPDIFIYLNQSTNEYQFIVDNITPVDCH